MKKYITLIFAAALMLAACNKQNPTPQFLPAPALAPYAQHVELQTPTDGYAWVEFTEAGRYIIAKIKLEGTKANEPEYEYITGNYWMQGDTYVLQNFGTVTLTGNSITITPTEEPPVQSTVTTTPQMEPTDLVTTVARTWVVDNIRVNLEHGGSAINITKPGCDFQVIMAELKKNGMNVDPDAWAGYNVTDVVLTKAQTFMIEFTDANPAIGAFTLSQEGAFNYTISITNGDEALTGSGAGQLNLENNRLVIQMNIEVHKGEKTKSGSIVLFLSEPLT